MTKRHSIFIVVVLGLISPIHAQIGNARAATQSSRPIPEIQRMLIISIDGLRPDVLLRAEAPHIRALCEAGSC
jgi:predicted AlkP superfamily pyrophosphatase or phosphodiesterase